MCWANKIRQLRTAMLLTQREFAKKLGVSFVSVNRWENGINEPTMRLKRDLTRLFLRYNIIE